MKNAGTKTAPAFNLVEIVSLLELVNASARIDQLLLTRKIGVALGADFDFQLGHVLGRSRLESISASAGDGHVMIIRMNTLFHLRTPILVFLHPHAPNYAYMIQSFFIINVKNIIVKDLTEGFQAEYSTFSNLSLASLSRPSPRLLSSCGISILPLYAIFTGLSANTK